MSVRMNLSAFRARLGDPAPPAGLSGALAALWWDARGRSSGSNDLGAFPKMDCLHSYAVISVARMDLVFGRCAIGIGRCWPVQIVASFFDGSEREEAPYG